MRNSPNEICSLDHIIERALGLRMSQQAFRGHQDERFADWHENLSTENVEIISWCRAVGDDPVDVCKLTNC